jgi:hypothetical protein
VPTNVYDVGDLATISVTFLVNTGTIPSPVWTPTDPTVITCEVRKPSGVIDEYVVTAGEIVRDGTGVYHLDLTPDEEGDWWYAFVGTGAAQARQEGGFLVQDQRVTESLLNPNALTSLHRARSYVLGSATQDSADDELVFLINWASEAIENYTKREFVPTNALDENDAPVAAATRKFDYAGGGFLNLSPYELRNVTSITLYSDLTTTQELVAATDYRLEPRGRTEQGTYLAVELIPGSRWHTTYDFGYEVEIVGDWGMASVPADVEGACLIMIKDLRMNPGAFGSYNVGPVQVSERDTVFTVPVGSVPPGARRALAPYLRYRSLGTISLSNPLPRRPAVRLGN